MTYYQVYEIEEENEFSLTRLCQCATELDARLITSMGKAKRSYIRMDLPCPDKLPNFQKEP